MKEIKVSVWVFVYNEEKYIRQCLDSLVMQKTNFPFEVLVHDDCSTDATPSIIQEYKDKYPNIVVPILEKENLFSQHISKIFRILMEKTRGVYITACDGDDYWTDELKLQKQADFLDNNKDFISHTFDVKEYFENTNTYSEQTKYNFLKQNSPEKKYVDIDYTSYHKSIGFMPMFLSTMFRNGDYLTKIPMEKYKYFRDTVFFHYVLQQGKGRIVFEPAVVYRKNDSGIYSGKSKEYNQIVTVRNVYDLYSIGGDKKMLKNVQIHSSFLIHYFYNQEGLKGIKKVFSILKENTDNLMLIKILWFGFTKIFNRNQEYKF